MAKRDKPLNVLIITGAGASTNLGANNTVLPMMKGWAADLIPRLGYAGHELGINEDTDGPAFEAIIGRFLKFANSLDAVAALGFMGDQTNVVGEGPRSGSNGNFASWLAAARNNVSALNRQLWVSLWENFGRERVDSEKAVAAYGTLHDLIRQSSDDGEPCYIAHVTTNFDTAIEVAIQESADSRVELLDGFTAASGNARSRWAPNLLTASRLDTDARIPVAHLHGAVGWYYDQRDTNRIERRPSDDDYDDRLTPALLLPDDTKNPDSFTAPLAEVWEQFRILLSGATHVFVIGHSLHDEHLVKALKEAEVPTAVMTLAEPSERVSSSKRVTGWDILDKSEVQRIESVIPGAVVIPGAFGAGYNDGDPDFDAGSFTKWLDRN